MYVRGAYWHLWETGGNVSSGSRVFLCADRLARARVLYEACGVDPQAVRQFQLAPVAVLGAVAPVRPRDKSALLAYFHALCKQWRAAVKNGSITKSAPTSRHPGKPKSTVESGHSMRHASLDTVDSALVMSTGVDAPSFVGRHVSPTRTLGALQEAQFDVV